MTPWYKCPICKKEFSPEQQRQGLVCQHTPEEWAKDVADFRSGEQEERRKPNP